MIRRAIELGGLSIRREPSRSRWMGAISLLALVGLAVYTALTYGPEFILTVQTMGGN